jgi:hypothetical protein
MLQEEGGGMAKITSEDMNARRNEVLSPEKRKEIARKAALARWGDKKAAKKTNRPARKK